jgi:hypothetical protein
MNSIGNFPKKFDISVASVTKPKNIVVFAFTCVRNFCTVFLAISAWNYILLTAMKRGDEAFNGSSLQFLRSVKRFIASIFYSALNASSPLTLQKNRRLTLYRRCFLKQIHRLTLHRC